jgi:hypothetical protein
VLPADALFFADRQRGRHDGAAGMRSSSGVVIVRLVGMGKFPVGDGRLDGSEEDIRGHDCANTRSAVGAGKFQGHAPRRKLGAGNHGGKGIEDVVLSFSQNFFWQRGVASFAHVGAELGHHWTDIFGGQFRAARNRRSREEPCRALHQIPPSQILSDASAWNVHISIAFHEQPPAIFNRSFRPGSHRANRRVEALYPRFLPRARKSRINLPSGSFVLRRSGL